MVKKDTLRKAVIVLSIVGLIIAGYQTYEHYFLSSSICDISASFSCSAVTESRFGVFPPSAQGGIATSAFGMLWWIGLLAITAGIVKGKEWLEDLDFWMFSYVVGGAVFVIYLLTVELYLLPHETGTLVICPLCTVQHFLIATILIISFFALNRPLREYLEDIFYTEA